MRIVTIMTAVLIATLANLATDAMAAEEIYRWVDENGVVHFGDMPPENGNVEQVTIEQSKINEDAYAPGTAAAEPDALAEPQPSLAQQLRDERALKRKEFEENKKITEEACAQRRSIVAQLEPSTRVMVKTEDGTVTRMDDDLRLETLNEAKKYIAENCNN
ncbi:MAG TPA: DUF4124 domain-containing protein [Xanthomonadales bacterium]